MEAEKTTVTRVRDDLITTAILLLEPGHNFSASVTLASIREAIQALDQITDNNNGNDIGHPLLEYLIQMKTFLRHFVRGITITEMWCLDEGLLVEEKRKLSDRCLIAADGCDSLLDILDAMADGDDLDGMPAPVFD